MNRTPLPPIGYALLCTALFALEAASDAQQPDPWAEARARMVKYEVVAAGVKDARVIDAIRTIPRHEFVPRAMQSYSCFDMGLPIGKGQTISSPFIVAYMTEQLEPQPTDKVLEIGTGSGYQAAVLSGLVAEVYSIEIVEFLGRRAAKTLDRLGYENVKTKIGDGYQGWPEHAPFDKIIVTCSPEDVPEPLVQQLKEGGRLVVPLGQRYQQTLYLFRKVDGKLQPDPLRPTFFVPMMGQAEEERDVLPDADQPVLLNGNFERAEQGLPFGWYYVRQGQVGPSGRAEGGNCLTLRNSTPGRAATALQAVGVDGREIEELEISAWVRALDAKSGPYQGQRPALTVVLFNSDREAIDIQGIGPWLGTFPWTQQRQRIKVPAAARLGSVDISLWGGTGEISVTEVELKVLQTRRQVGSRSAR
ncbi:MAG: protein-L-isoaspartate(D-aspartate) O-methyltransferase [Planctomycetaceae bacterium]|nr:protein-L-isoaspartate(D-aspartate) O-methyltransferase [Planctomycetaceae bacterium]